MFLLGRGYEVAVGKIDDKEIDFVATKMDEKKYIQVTHSILDAATQQRELEPLKKVRDSYDKIVLTMDSNLYPDVDGIKVINVIDYLLNE